MHTFQCRWSSRLKPCMSARPCGAPKLRESPLRGYRHHEWAQWLKGLVKLAPNLVTLQLQLPRSPDLPAMPHLRHLILHLDDTSRQAGTCQGRSMPKTLTRRLRILASAPTKSSTKPHECSQPLQLEWLLSLKTLTTLYRWVCQSYLHDAAARCIRLPTC